jgi:hypothetical protein
MGRIYSQSQLCIIAAAGKDPNYGLPGVSKRHRKPQAHISLGELDLLEFFLSPKSVHQSLWSSRGWTLQEGCLSRRRLIFTDEETVFSCHEMCCQESLNSDDREDSNETYDGYSGTTLAKTIPGIWEREPENMCPTPGGLIQSLLSSYSSRLLRYDTDIINAIQGVYGVLNVRHCWGIPFEKLPDRKAWTMSLNWVRAYGGSRRTEFPSWSWASTKAITTFNRADTSPSILDIEVSLPNNNWRNIDDYMRSCPLSSDNDLGKLLSVTGYVSRPYFVEIPRMSGALVVLKISESSYWVCTIQEDIESSSQSMMALNTLNLVALLIDDGRAEKKRMRKYLVLVPHGSHFRRIGITNGHGDEYSLEGHHPGAGLSSKQWEFLQRTDDDFFAGKVRRTLILE